jgi:hypothetical protein
MNISGTQAEITSQGRQRGNHLNGDDKLECLGPKGGPVD